MCEISGIWINRTRNKAGKEGTVVSRFFCLSRVLMLSISIHAVFVWSIFNVLVRAGIRFDRVIACFRQNRSVA